MMWTNRLARFATGVALFAAAAMPAAWAQDYPNRPIKIVIPNTPGTNPDLIARVMGPEMSKILGQPVVVENRPGAAQVIGYEYASKSAPDGYTLILAISSEVAILPLVNKELRFDPGKDLVPVIGIAEATMVLGTGSAKPWKHVNDLVAYAKGNPGKLNYGASSPATLLPMLAFLRHYGIDGVGINYKGGAPFQQAVMTGEADIGFFPESYYSVDRMRPLAATSPQRLAAFPDVPTFHELGTLRIPQQSYSFSVPAGTPRPVMAKLHGAISAVLKQPEVRARLEKAHLKVVEQTGEESAATTAGVVRTYADIAKRAGITPN